MAHGRVEAPAPPLAQGTLQGKKNGANGFSQKPQLWQRDGQQCVQLKEEGLERGNVNDLGEWEASNFPAARPLGDGLPANLPAATHVLGAASAARRRSGSFMRERPPSCLRFFWGPAHSHSLKNRKLCFLGNIQPHSVLGMLGPATGKVRGGMARRWGERALESDRVLHLNPVQLCQPGQVA